MAQTPDSLGSKLYVLDPTRAAIQALAPTGAGSNCQWTGLDSAEGLPVTRTARGAAPKGDCPKACTGLGEASPESRESRKTNLRHGRVCVAQQDRREIHR